MHDAVNHPSHYASGGLSAYRPSKRSSALKSFRVTFAEMWSNMSGRWKEKGGRQDLQKANWYLTKLLEVSES